MVLYIELVKVFQSKIHYLVLKTAIVTWSEFICSCVGVTTTASSIGVTKVFAVYRVSQSNNVIVVTLPVFGVTLSVFGVTLSVFGVTLSVFGVTLPVFGVTLSVFGVTLSVFGVTLSVFGVTLSVSVFDVELFIDDIDRDPTRDGECPQKARALIIY